MIIGISIQNYWKLKPLDSIDPSSASPQLPTEEYDKLIASLFGSDDLKDILLDHKNKDIEGDKKRTSAQQPGVNAQLQQKYAIR